MILAEEAEEAVRDIIDRGAGRRSRGTEERKFGDLLRELHGRGAHRAARRARRSSRSWRSRADVDSIPSLLATLGALERHGLGGFYQLFVDNDPGDPERYLVFVEQAGISACPTSRYYREEKFARDPRGVRRAHPADVRARRPRRRRRERAQRVFDLETAIAAHHWDNVAVPRLREDLQPAAAGTTRSSFAGAAAGGADLDVLAQALRRARRRARRGRAAPAVSFIERPRRRCSPTTASRPGRTGWRWQVIRGAAAVPLRATSSRRTSTSTAARSPARPRCARAGSAASRSSRARWARPSAASTSSGTSRRRRRSAWMCSSPT